MSLSFGSEKLMQAPRDKNWKSEKNEKNGKYYNDACEYVGFMPRLIVEQKAPKQISRFEHRKFLFGTL